MVKKSLIKIESIEIKHEWIIFIHILSPIFIKINVLIRLKNRQMNNHSAVLLYY